MAGQWGEKVFYTISFGFEANKAMKSLKGHYELEEYPRFSESAKLYVNGNEVESTMRLSGTSKIFQLEFDVLPTDKIESIDLELVNFGAYHKLKEPILLASPSDRSIKVGDEKLWIRSVTKTETGYDIVISRKETLCFVCFQNDPLSIQAGGKVVPVSSISEERPWDLKNGNILKEQTYSFKSTDKPDFLLMDGFQYLKTFKKKISIPEGKYRN